MPSILPTRNQLSTLFPEIFYRAPHASRRLSAKVLSRSKKGVPRRVKAARPRHTPSFPLPRTVIPAAPHRHPRCHAPSSPLPRSVIPAATLRHPRCHAPSFPLPRSVIPTPTLRHPAPPNRPSRSPTSSFPRRRESSASPDGLQPSGWSACAGMTNGLGWGFPWRFRRPAPLYRRPGRKL
jgi:hypothetical protein